jgi:hypothetical protein
MYKPHEQSPICAPPGSGKQLIPKSYYYKAPSQQSNRWARCYCPSLTDEKLEYQLTPPKSHGPEQTEAFSCPVLSTTVPSKWDKPGARLAQVQPTYTGKEVTLFQLSDMNIYRKSFREKLLVTKLPPMKARMTSHISHRSQGKQAL